MIITDLDGTLFDTKQRGHLIPTDVTNPESWIPWHMACAGDSFIQEVVDIHNLHEPGAKVLLSRRIESARAITEGVLRFIVNYDDLVLAADDDPRPPLEYKAAMIPKILVRYGYEDGRRFTFMDDNPAICQHVRDTYPQALVIQVTHR